MTRRQMAAAGIALGTVVALLWSWAGVVVLAVLLAVVVVWRWM